jgi:hypothetical protein
MESLIMQLQFIFKTFGIYAIALITEKSPLFTKKKEKSWLIVSTTKQKEK